jgi:hypothetical protein
MGTMYVQPEKQYHFFHFLDLTSRRVRKTPKIFPCKQLISRKNRFIMPYSSPIMKFLQIQIITHRIYKIITHITTRSSKPKLPKNVLDLHLFGNNWQHSNTLTWATCKWQKPHLGPSHQKPKTHNER